MKYDFDVAVIGAGSGGLTVAFGLAAAGKTVALIEKGKMGGDCTNYGCIPSKALIDIAKSGKYKSLKDALVEVRARRKIIQDEETVDKIEGHGVTVFESRAFFHHEHCIILEDCKSKEISAEYIVIATGSSAMKLNIDGVDKKDILTNKTIFEQQDEIKKLVIIGGGYIGCELAESISAVGTEVSIIQRNTDLIPAEEAESSQLIKKIFKKKGIAVYTDFTGKKSKNKSLHIVSGDEKTSHDIQYDKILFALGRKPNVIGIGLNQIGIKHDKKGIFVDAYNRTNIKHIFAIGDCVNGNPQFTHWVNNEGRGVVRNILFPYYKSGVRNKTLPSVLYTHQEIARVGKTKNELLEYNSPEDIVTKMQAFENNDRSKVTNSTQGFIMIHFKRLTGRILGATIYGENAGEMIGQITLAMDNKISAYKFSNVIQAYPTKSDLLKRVNTDFVISTLTNGKEEMKYFFKNNILQILTGIIWIAIITGFFWYKISTDQSFEEIALSFYNFVAGNPIGILIFIIAYTLRPIILFPASLMTLMAGALFGFGIGLAVTLAGAGLSATTAYVIGLIFGKKILSPDDSGILGKLQTETSKNPFTSVLMTRILFLPYDLTNYICGFLKVPYVKYILATLVGIIPGSSVFVLAGSAFYNKELTSFSQAFENVNSMYIYIAAGVFLLTLIVAKVIRKYQK
ncbi:FAD-dependent oxidoreductase [Candidatus Gracilibacteria bacterium]|nr:FAD-dependent oxidoreductase [Candidatus Gracilibacteria bacterium]